MRSLALFLTLALPALTQPADGLRQTDRARLAEAFRLADAVGDDLWPGWGDVPFAVLLIEGDHEVLVRHPAPPADFALVDALDPLLDSPVYTRPRQFAPTLLATFPLDGVPTVVVGTPEATGLASTEWVLTLVHEHLHQLQMGSPGYFAAVDALGLSGGDTTGMWMLDYPFPYTDAAVGARVNALRDALLDALASSAGGAAIDAARSALDAALDPADARYLAFQLWQEGAGRYTELRTADLAATRGEPVAAYRALPDAVPYPAADTLRRRLARDLAGLDLSADGRIAVYALGAALALALDDARPGWRRRYLADRFALPRLAD